MSCKPIPDHKGVDVSLTRRKKVLALTAGAAIFALTLAGCSDSAEKTDGASTDGWDADPVELWSIWRGGPRIFMRLSLPYSTEPRKFSLVLDPATEHEAVPTLLLWHERATDTPTFDRRYYAAFDIAPLWEDAAVKGVRVRVANSLNPSQCEFTFMKQ